MKTTITQIITTAALLFGTVTVQAQVKIGSNPTVISPNANLEVEATNGDKTVIRKDIGDVGIGTISPAERMHVITTGNNHGIALSNATYSNVMMMNTNLNGPFLAFITASADPNTALSSYIIHHGANSTSPELANDLLYQNFIGDHVFAGGNLKITNLAGAGIRPIGVDPTGMVVVIPSDSRLKKDVTNLNTGLDKVMKLRPVYYNWKNMAEYGKQRELGFIAQEVKELIPEITGTFTKDGEEYNTVSYDRLVPVLAKAIQEQQAQIEALKSENTTLKAQMAKVDNLASKLVGMEAKLQMTSTTPNDSAVSEKAK